MSISAGVIGHGDRVVGRIVRANLCFAGEVHVWAAADNILDRAFGLGTEVVPSIEAALEQGEWWTGIASVGPFYRQESGGSNILLCQRGAFIFGPC